MFQSLEGTWAAARRTLAGVRLLCICGVVLGGGCAAESNTPQPPRTLRFATGVPGAGFNPLGAALGRAYRAIGASVQLETQESPGSVSNLLALQDGSSDVGLAFADVAYLANAGQLPDAGERPDRLRGIAVLQLTPLQVVVRPGAAIERIEELKGRRVAIGPPGSGTQLTATLVLQTLGVGPADIKGEPLLFNEAARRLVEGRVDAMFVNGSYPAESVRLALRAGSRLLPVSPAEADRLRMVYPFFRPMIVPGGTYPGHPGSVHTIGIDTLLVCRSDLDPESVYRFTRTLFEVLPTLVAEHPTLKNIDLEQVAATPVALHAGAARYYREREINR
ncbi:MAG: TAXI family TRAP transporter solute-binding subunit [Vicinamibacterales bacterium]